MMHDYIIPLSLITGFVVTGSVCITNALRRIAAAIEKIAERQDGAR